MTSFYPVDKKQPVCMGNQMVPSEVELGNKVVTLGLTLLRNLAPNFAIAICNFSTSNFK